MNKKKIAMVVMVLAVVGLVIHSFMSPVDMSNLDNYTSSVYGQVWALLPPAIAIILALITKEVYTSLLAGIMTGALLYSGFNFELMINTMFFNEDGGMAYKLASSSNIGILLFLVMLGILVALMYKAGGSAAFGRWAVSHIKTRVGAQLATMVLGIVIFVDDYFNCLTVGSVMRPVTDTHKVSRAKLSYIIDSTAAPVCIIAPISSWAAAVTSSVPDDSDINGFTTFLRTIPYNFYAILTLIMVVFVIVRKVDFGAMRKHEINAINGDLYTTPERPFKDEENNVSDKNGKVSYLIFPVVVLIASCIVAMLYTGGFFSGAGFIQAFSESNASVGLVLGSAVTLFITFVMYMFEDVLTFEEFTDCISEGFKAMVSPILILTFAWTLSGMTNLLGADIFVANLVAGWAGSLQNMLPAIIFIVSMFLAFATGTSWGTFGILIPIVIGVFPTGEMLVISIASCLAGAVCGDHCSPISDTTIMASAGGQCYHMNHVTTQLPYVITAASISFIGYIIAGLTQNVYVSLGICIVLLITVLFIIEKKTGQEESV